MWTNNTSLTTVCKQSVVKNQHGLADLIGNGALFIFGTVLEIHKHVDLCKSMIEQFKMCILSSERICWTFVQIYLLLWRGTKFTGLARCLGCTHGESKHEFIVALPLVGLYLAHKHVWKGDNSLHPVAELTVAEILQQSAHLWDKNPNLSL